MAAVLSPKVSFRRESPKQIWEEILPLLQEHFVEIATYRDIPLSVDQDVYDRAEEAGVLRVYTARIDGDLIGYACFLMRPNPHYSGSIQAVADVVFISEAYRRGRLGLQLLQFADNGLTADGAQVIYHHVKLAHPALGRLLEHMGYEPVETIYVRRTD